MLSRTLRSVTGRLLTPVADLLLRARVPPDAVTLVGTAGVCAGAALYPTGRLFAGTLVISVFALSDALDGTMARRSGRSSAWGAFLDSTLDRVADAAVFAALVLWFTAGGDDRPTALLALACLVLGGLVPYARARAEGLGMRADVGVAERTDRLVAVLLATGFVGLGAPVLLLTLVLGALAVASALTVGQRVVAVRRQAVARVDGA